MQADRQRTAPGSASGVKTAGIIGGIGPESTIAYYRLIVAGYRERRPDGSYPRVLIDSIDLKTLLDLVEAGRLKELTDYLLESVERLSRAGAEFGALASNTPHVVFGSLVRRSPIPLLSIVETACRSARRRGFRRVGLLGTRFTMQGTFYREVFDAAGIVLVIPDPKDQDYVHHKYLGELVQGVLLPETREGLLAVVERLKTREGIEALILGGTELPLILRAGKDEVVPFLDTTRLHVEEIVDRMLGPATGELA